MLGFRALGFIIYIIGFASISTGAALSRADCPLSVPNQRIIDFVDSAFSPTHEAQYLKTGKWILETSEVPFTVEGLVAGGFIAKPYCTHSQRDWKRDTWQISSTRGIVNIGTALKMLRDDRAQMSAIRKSMAEYGLTVKVNERFHEILKGCVESPHAVPLWNTDPVTKEMTFADWKKVNGQNVYYSSTWVSPAIQALWKDAYEKGVAHSIGVFAADGKLVAGTILLVADGHLYSVSAFTASEITEVVSGPEATDILDRNFLVNRPYDNVGQVELAATLQFGAERGFTHLDVGTIFEGLGVAKLGGVKMPHKEYVRLVESFRYFSPVPDFPDRALGPIDITDRVIQVSDTIDPVELRKRLRRQELDLQHRARLARDEVKRLETEQADVRARREQMKPRKDGPVNN